MPEAPRHSRRPAHRRRSHAGSSHAGSLHGRGLHGRGLHGRGLRRAASHAGLIFALWAVLAACATAAGASALLVTTGNDRALSAAITAADGNADSDSADIATVFVSTSTGEGKTPANAAEVIPLTRQVLLAAAAPYRATVSIWATTPMFYLPGDDVQRGYLLDADTVASNASLLSGSWPSATVATTGPIEVAIPSPVAARLGIGVGSHLRLSEQRQHGDEVPAGYDVVIVGVFSPAQSAAWARDPLRGAGFDPDYDWLPAYGPFVVAPGTLAARAAPLANVSAIVDPDLAGDATRIPQLVRGFGGIAPKFEGEVGQGIETVVVRHRLGAAFAEMRSELSLTNSLVISVSLLVLALGMATVALVARVLARRRAVEVTLLRDRGASTAQLARSVAAETLVLAVAAIAVAAPLSLMAYSAVAGSQRWSGSWASVVAPSPGVGGWMLVAAVAGAVVPSVVVIATALPVRASRRREALSGPLASSGIDVMLALIAVTMYLQLRSHVVSPGAIDPILVIAPAMCAIALAALVARLLPLVARAANGAARRARGIVLPVAGWHVARGGAVHGTFLVVLAAAVGTLGVTFLGTWSASQSAQADAAVGADLVVAQPGAPGMGAELAAATGGTVTPVADGAVVLGSRPDGVRVVALDASKAGMIRGALPGGASWSSEMQGLAPEQPGVPVVINGSALSVTITGAPHVGPYQGEAATVRATPTFVLVGEAGDVTTLVGDAVALDNLPHAMALPGQGAQPLPAGKWRIVAVDFLLSENGSGDLSSWGDTKLSASVSIRVDGADSNGGDWDATTSATDGTVRPGTASLANGTVTASFSYAVLPLSWQDAHLTLVSFPASTEVPVAMSQGLATSLGLAVGDRIAMVWETTPVDARLVRTVPYVSSQVRQDAVLADLTALHRALLSAGNIDSPTDRWWVSSPDAGAADALRAQHVGPVTTSQETATAYRDGPVRVSLRVAWAFAIAAAVLLATTGAASHAVGEARQRAPAVARLRAIGVSRRATLASHLMQHAAVTIAATLLGAGSGAVLALLIAPLLVVAPGGQRAVPPAVVVWSAAPTAIVIAAIAAGGIIAGIPAAVAMVRRSTVAALRSGDAT